MRRRSAIGPAHAAAPKRQTEVLGTVADEGARSGAAGRAGRGGRHAAEVAGGILGTRGLGDLRERAVAHYIGNGWAAGALRVGQRPPHTIPQPVRRSTQAASLLPRYWARQERGEKTRRAP